MRCHRLAEVSPRCLAKVAELPCCVTLAEVFLSCLTEVQWKCVTKASLSFLAEMCLAKVLLKYLAKVSLRRLVTESCCITRSIYLSFSRQIARQLQKIWLGPSNGGVY